MTLVLVVALALLWAAVTGGFSLLNLVWGAAIGTAAVFLLRYQIGEPQFLRRAWRIFGLVALFVYELVLSAIRVAIVVLSPDLKRRLKPAIIAYPLTIDSDIGITLLANVITLTPGTMSVDVSEDRKTLYLHALVMEDREALIADIAQGFERRIIEVLT